MKPRFTKDELIQLFTDKSYLLLMGAGKLSKRFRVPKDLIYECRSIVKANTKSNISTKISKLPKILILDIETAPLKGYVWSLWKQNIYGEQLISNFFMLTWSAKWLYTTDVMSDRLSKHEVLNEDDSRIVRSIHTLLDEADIVIGHNGEKFDLPKIRTRCIINGLKSNLFYNQIDTLKVVKREFGFTSNSLSSLARDLGFDGKLSTDFKLWKSCLEGDEQALEYMETYNKQDVLLLEEVYLKLRPWIRNHPNINMYTEIDEIGCGNCGHTHLTKKGFYYTQTNRFETYVCDECGALNRTRIADKFRPKNNLLIPLAK